MADFVELPDKGWWLNLDDVRKFHPERSNRLDYVNGDHGQLTEVDAQALLKAFRAPSNPRIAQLAESRRKKQGRPKKTETQAPTKAPTT